MTGFKRLCTFLITAVLVMTLLPAGAFADYQVGLYKITPDNGVNLRDAPNGNKIGAIACGKTVTVTEISGEWGKTTVNDMTGWFSLAYAAYQGAVPDQPDTPSTQPDTYKITTAVNLRSEPSTSATRVTTLPQGALVVVTEIQSGWGYTSYGDYSGWFSMQYAEKQENVTFTVGTYAIGHPTTLRESADAASAAILTLPINATVEVTEISGGWGKTTYQDKTGWFNLNNAATSQSADQLTGDQRADIIRVALGEVGKTDGSKYTYGRGDVAWCAYFVSWCARQAGVPTSVIQTNGYARAYYHVDTYYKSSDYLPSPGDLVYFDWSKYDGDMNHVGIVTEVKSDGTICTVEGNSSDAVRQKTYTPNSGNEYTSTASISYYGVPNYNKAATSVSNPNAVAGSEKGSVRISFEATGASYYDIYITTVGGNAVSDSVARVRTASNEAIVTGLETGSYEAVVFARPGGADSAAASPRAAFVINAAGIYYKLTVNGGKGSGSYAQGSRITVEADPPAEKMIFSGWSASAGSLENAASSQTVLIMPAADVTLTAHYVLDPGVGGYTTTASLNLRSEPSTSASRLATIPKGTDIVITDYSDNWGKTTYDGKTGWVSMDYTTVNTAFTFNTGWFLSNGSWYYRNQTGDLQKGWMLLDGKWYYMDTSGVMQTGWVRDNGKWYYMNASGAMQTGWIYVGNAWYYMNTSGVMQTGWVYADNAWYYMDTASGAMRTGWVKDSKKWYYLDDSGAMQTGWVYTGGKWYYMNASGVMQTGKIKVDGKTYKLGSDGAWIA